MAAKPMLTPRDIESQVALELPERDMLSLATVIVAGNNVGVGANVCVAALAAQNCQVGIAQH